MKHLLSMIAVALALAVGSTAMAGDHDGHRFDRGHSYRGDYRGHRGFDHRRSFYGDHRSYDNRRSYGDRRFYNDRRFVYDRRFDDRRFYNDRRFYDRRFYNDRRFFSNGYYYRSWRRGDRLPSVFFNTRFVVNDFSGFGLYRPPRGYRWHRVGSDAFLVGLTTGVIIGIVADRF